MSKDEKIVNGNDAVDEVETVKQKKKKKSEKELLLEDIEALQQENKLLDDKQLRAIAELENYKRRVENEKTEYRKYHNIYLLEKLLPALDQFNLVVNAEVEDEKLRNYLIGFKMINNQIFDILEEDGLKMIETDGKQFDPKYHDAVETIKDESLEKGTIVSTRQTGYMYKERIIRPAMVVVNEWSDENGNN